MTTIKIPAASLTNVEADLEGLEPGLLLNPFGRKAETALLASMQKKVARLARPDKDPDKEYDERLAEVTCDGGSYWVNILCFKAAMVRGAKSVDKLPMTTMREGVFVQPDGVDPGAGKPIARLKGTPQQYTCRVANKGGSPDLRTRVLLTGWTYTLKFSVNQTLVSVDQVVTSLVNAGLGTGVGDWRPEKSGVHGRWKVTAVRIAE